jgi:Ca2+-binding EF-hand superfamily protein
LNPSTGINFIEFAKALMAGPLSKDKKEQDMFVFRIYDIDGDNEISTFDLIELQSKIPHGSPLSHELKNLFNQIV